MAGNSVIGALRVNLGLDSAQFQTGLKNTQSSLGRFQKQTEGMFAGLAKNTEGMFAGLAKNFARGLFAGVAAGGVAGLVAQVGSVAKGMAQIGDEAKRAGMEVKAFQEWGFVAKQNRIGIDAMVDGFKELNLRADEFISTGGGPAAEAFQRLGYSVADLNTKLKDPSALMLEIIGRMQQLNSDAARIRVADEIFGGTAGERFVELIGQGRKGIEDTMQRGRELGAVIDKEMIQKAAELDRRFNEVATSVGSTLKSAIVSAADSLAEFIDGFRAMEQRRDRTLDDRQAEIGRQMLELEGRIIEAQERGGRNAGKAVNTARIEMEKLREESERIALVLAKRTPSMARSGDTTWTPPTPPPGGFKPLGGSKERDREAEKILRERQAVTELIAALEEELSLVGQTEQAKRAAAAAREAGAHATEEERDKIIALNEAIYQAAEAEDRRKNAIEEVGNMALDGVQQLTDAVNTGNEALDEMISRLIMAVAQAALLGQGPLAGLFGGGILAGTAKAFPAAPLGGGLASGIGLFASGGPVRGPGGPKDDSILARLSNGEFVVNAEAAKRWRGLLVQINSGMKMPEFNAGGFVMPPMSEHGGELVIARST